MLEIPSPPAPTSADTKARIIAAAQAVFSEKGYSHAGMREIAQRAGVATSLLTKYFKQKKLLFEDALVDALVAPEALQSDRPNFGKAIATTIIEQEWGMRAPAMMALSLGDAEAREVVSRVAREHILAPMMRWLGPSMPEARAANILMMTMGFAIFSRHMKLLSSDRTQLEAAEIFAQSVQEIVDWE